MLREEKDERYARRAASELAKLIGAMGVTPERAKAEAGIQVSRAIAEVSKKRAGDLGFVAF